MNDEAPKLNGNHVNVGEIKAHPLTPKDKLLALQMVGTEIKKHLMEIEKILGPSYKISLMARSTVDSRHLYMSDDELPKVVSTLSGLDKITAQPEEKPV